jgi:hypothetical protein
MSHPNKPARTARPTDDSKAWLRVWLPPVLAALLFAVTLYVLHQAIRYRDVREALHALPPVTYCWRCCSPRPIAWS